MLPTAKTPLLVKNGDHQVSSCQRCGLIIFLAGMGICLGLVACCPRLGAHLAMMFSVAVRHEISAILVTQFCQVSAPMLLLVAAIVGQITVVPWLLNTRTQPPSQLPKPQILTRTQRLIKAQSNPEERKKLLDEEAAVVESKQFQEEEGVDAPLVLPPCTTMEDGGWRIAGIYEHQMLKIGLRLLDSTWSEDGLFELPQRVLLRKSLLSDLLKKRIKLNSVHCNDLTAAQHDLRSLTVRQLLRLRVSHLNFTPSGCGSDIVGSLGGTHQAFLASADRLLFENLGRQAAGKTVPVPASEHHRLGRDAVFFSAAAAVVPSPSSWVLWLQDRRHYFDAAHFSIGLEFPTEEGVLEANDCSKPDSQEPTGRLRWFDWHVSRVLKEEQLSCQQNSDISGSTDSAASLLALSPTLLSQSLTNLKKVDRNGKQPSDDHV